MTTSWSRSPLQHLRYPVDNIKTHYQLSECCWCKCSRIIIRLWYNDCRNHQFRCAVLPVSVTETVSWVPPSRLCQFDKLCLLLPKALHTLLYRYVDCAHHPAGFIIFAQLALLCLFIMLIFPIIPIFGTCKIAQTVSDIHNHRLKHPFGLSGCQFRASCCPCAFQLLPVRCLCICNSRSCQSGFSLNITVDSFLFVFISYEVRFLSFVGHTLLVDCKLRDALRARTVSASKPLLPSFAWWDCWVDHFVDLP